MKNIVGLWKCKYLEANERLSISLILLNKFVTFLCVYNMLFIESELISVNEETLLIH